MAARRASMTREAGAINVDGVLTAARTGAIIRGSSIAALVLTFAAGRACSLRVFEMGPSPSGLVLVFPSRICRHTIAYINCTAATLMLTATSTLASRNPSAVSTVLLRRCLALHYPSFSLCNMGTIFTSITFARQHCIITPASACRQPGLAWADSITQTENQPFDHPKTNMLSIQGWLKSNASCMSATPLRLSVCSSYMSTRVETQVGADNCAISF